MTPGAFSFNGDNDAIVSDRPDSGAADGNRTHQIRGIWGRRELDLLVT
jgi:hypothetical protein